MVKKSDLVKTVCGEFKTIMYVDQYLVLTYGGGRYHPTKVFLYFISNLSY
jgi:hypothetical protein